MHLHNPSHMADLAIAAAHRIQVIVSLFTGEAKLLAPSTLPGSFTLDKSSKSISNTNNFYPPHLPTSERKVLLLAFSLGFFSSLTLLSFLTVVPSGFLLDKDLPQGSHCQMNFTQSPKRGSVALNLHPRYLNMWLAELHMSKTLVLNLLKFGKAIK